MATLSHIHCAALILYLKRGLSHSSSQLNLLALSHMSLSQPATHLTHKPITIPPHSTHHTPQPDSIHSCPVYACASLCASAAFTFSLNCDALISLSLACAHTLPLFHSASFLFSFLSLELVCSALLLRRQLTQHQS